MATNEARLLIVTDDRITNTNLLDLVDSGETTLHSHSGGGGLSYTGRDPVNYDYIHTGAVPVFTSDNAWHEFDLSAIVPEGAVLVHIRTVMKDANTTESFQWRKGGQTNVRNVFSYNVLVANAWASFSDFIECDANRNVGYIVSGTFDNINVCIRGWWA